MAFRLCSKRIIAKGNVLLAMEFEKNPYPWVVVVGKTTFMKNSRHYSDNNKVYPPIHSVGVDNKASPAMNGVAVDNKASPAMNGVGVGVGVDNQASLAMNGVAVDNKASPAMNGVAVDNKPSPSIDGVGVDNKGSGGDNKGSGGDNKGSGDSGGHDYKHFRVKFLESYTSFSGAIAGCVVVRLEKRFFPEKQEEGKCCLQILKQLQIFNLQLAIHRMPDDKPQTMSERIKSIFVASASPPMETPKEELQKCLVQLLLESQSEATGTMIKLFTVEEKQRELAEKANGKPPVKKQSAGELRVHKGTQSQGSPQS